MKILYSHRTRSADGQWVHISALTSALSVRGHEVFMCGPGNDKVRTLDVGDGRRAAAWLPKPFYECAEYGYSFPAFLKLRRAAEGFAPDVLYERYNLFFHAGAWLKRKLGLPMILEINAPLAEERALHGGLSLKMMARRSEAAIWRAADKVLPVTNALAGHVRAAGVAEERIEVVQNGVDAAFLKVRDPGTVRARYNLDGKLVLGFAGFVRDWHGVDRAVRFLAASARKDLHLLIVGDGPARQGLETLAEELGVADRVTITGVVQRGDMPDYIAAFDIALQPSVVAYASPLKLFEYMAQGKAVAAPACANIREVLSDGEDGLLFANDGFETALAKLVDDASLRTRLGGAARDTIINGDYTWAGNARRVEAIAESLRSSGV